MRANLTAIWTAQWRRMRCRKPKDEAAKGDKKLKDGPAPSRPPPQLKAKAAAAKLQASSNGYLAGVDLPSSDDDDEEVEVVEREEKHIDMSQQARSQRERKLPDCACNNHHAPPLFVRSGREEPCLHPCKAGCRRM
jgi:hypothetical protein